MSIRKMCEFCTELQCASGASGAEQERRVRQIKSDCITRRQMRAKKLLAFALWGVTVPIILGAECFTMAHAQLLQATSSLPTFDVATIRPSDPGRKDSSTHSSIDGFSAENQPLDGLFRFAYNVSADAQLALPEWTHYANYDINAKIDPDTVAAMGKMPPDQRVVQIRLMMQALLIERFKVRASVQTKQLPVYALVVAKGGPKMVKSPCAIPCLTASTSERDGRLIGTDAPIRWLISAISRHSEDLGGRTVLDETGLKDSYTWTLTWSPADSKTHDDGGPSLFTALQEQLGLRLEPTTAPVPVLVVDHIERPTEN